MTGDAVSARLQDLLVTTKDGDWGRESAANGFVPYRVIRGTDFPSARTGDMSSVPIRYLNAATVHRRTLELDDILLETAGGSPGRPTGCSLLITERLLSSLDFPATCASFARFLRVNRSTADPRYVYWFLQYLYASGRMEEHQVQHTGVARFQYTRFADSQLILLPTLPEQRAIAHILGTLDDKIELNRRMNETLEAMARAIFKSWFVGFDPVRAKAENRDPGLPRSLAELFPARLVHSELGEIPEGWEVGRVGNVGNVICGKTPPTQVSEYYGDDVPFITIPDMHGKIFATATQKRLSHAGAASQQKKMLPAGAICVSCIATPGLVVIAAEPAQTNQQINTVVPSQSDETYFWFWALRNLGDKIRAGGSGGSVLTNLSTGRFSELKVLSPPSGIRSSYHFLVAPAFGRILESERESRTLASLRDTLLPKLISGELRVEDAERQIAQAI